MRTSIYTVLSPRDSNIITHCFVSSCRENVERESIDFLYKSLGKQYYQGETISAFLFDVEIENVWKRSGLMYLELGYDQTNKFKSMIYDMYLIRWNVHYTLPNIEINGLTQRAPNLNYFCNPRLRMNYANCSFQVIKSNKVSIELIKYGDKLIDKNMKKISSLEKK